MASVPAWPPGAADGSSRRVAPGVARVSRPDSRHLAGFGRHRRLLKGSEFDRVFAAPRRSSDRFFTVLARDNGREYPRLGIAVGKKRVRRAVTRNRIKRLVRESFRQHAATLGGVDVVVLARFDGLAANADLLASLGTHWHRIGMPHERRPGRVGP